MAVNSAAALSREANSLPENGSGSFFLGPGLTFVAAAGERPLHLHGLALRAFDLCLPHVEVAGDPEIVLANQASTLMDLGRYEEAQAAATRALQCQELPGSIQSFAQHSVGRAAEAQGGTLGRPPARCRRVLVLVPQSAGAGATECWCWCHRVHSVVLVPA